MIEFAEFWKVAAAMAGVASMFLGLVWRVLANHREEVLERVDDQDTTIRAVSKEIREIDKLSRENHSRLNYVESRINEDIAEIKAAQKATAEDIRNILERLIRAETQKGT